MKSLLDVRLGVQMPQIVHLPPDVHSLAGAEEAIELADSYGLCDGHSLDESQRFTLRAGLGERSDGSWAATQVADFKGRQGGGKSDSVAARELAGLVLFDEPLIIHTAHEFPTANESFLRLVALFENHDDLRRRVRRVLYGNGTQSINLLSGQRILYKARTGGAGRGFTKAALVVYDEAQHLQGEHVAASGPARLAYPNSQSWYAGSGGFSTSAATWRLRRRALSGEGGRLAYCEGTAEQVSLVDGRVVSIAPDPKDPNAWARANPGLGRWVTEESMAALYDELGPELFARECLCIWDPEPNAGGSSLVGADTWDACLAPGHEPTGTLSYALDVDTNAKGEEWCSVAASDGTHVEIVTPPSAGPGVTWVVPTVAAKAEAVGELLIDPAGPAGKLIPALEAQGITIRKVTAQEIVQACMHLKERIDEGLVRHIGQPALTRAVAGARPRDVGDGAWRFSRKRSVDDISPLMAVTLACWGSQLADDGDFLF